MGLAVLLASGCAARGISFPADSGSPLPDFEQIHAQASAACRGVRTLTGELSLSGRAGSQRLRGRVLAGFERPGAMRLEGVAPFGPPAFILAARDTMATLLLPRDGRVVRDAQADDILGALTGVALTPADLLAILTGCVTAEPRAMAGRLHQNGWAAIDLDGGATVYLERRNGGWNPRAARRGGWQLEYPMWVGAFPQLVRLRSNDGTVDLAVTLGQIETNTAIDAAAFTVDVPASARELTVEELRQAGPLRGDS